MMPLGSERAPKRSKFMSFLFSMSGTLSAGILVAWHVIFMLFLFPGKWVLEGFTIRPLDAEKIPFLTEQSWKKGKCKETI